MAVCAVGYFSISTIDLVELARASLCPFRFVTFDLVSREKALKHASSPFANLSHIRKNVRFRRGSQGARDRQLTLRLRSACFPTSGSLCH